MKKILNRVMAAAIAVPMVLTQGAVMNISAEPAGTTSLSIDDFTRIAPEKTESEWNILALNAILNMEGANKAIPKDDLAAILPETNSYAVLLKEVMADSADPILTVKDGVVKISGTADISSYAEKEIYSKVRKALAENGFDGTVEMNEFNKTISYEVTADANVLQNGKNVDVNVTLTCDGTNIKTGAADYFKGLADEMIASVEAQVKAYYEQKIADASNDPEVVEELKAEMEANMAKLAEGLSGAGVKLINQLEKAERYAQKAATFERKGSYASADEMMADVADYVNKKEGIYDVPSSVDEAVARHGNGFNKVVEIINDVSATGKYSLDISVDDVATLAKSGTNFELAIAGGTYDVTFQIADDEAAEVEAYVNKTNTEGMVYDSSYKIVEAKADVQGNVYYNVTRVIKLKKAETTSSTTTTTTATDTTTSESQTTTTTTGSETTTTGTETTTTGSETTTSSTTTSSTTSTSGSDTIPAEFVLNSVEVTAGKGYYFSHDENAFDLTELVESLTLVGTLDGEDKTIEISASDFATYLTPAYATPAAFYEAKASAYVAEELGLTFTAPETMDVADDADLTITDVPVVYIGVKGDVNLDAAVDISDASAVLTYYASVSAKLDASFNDDADLNTLAYFLADIDTESEAGGDSDDGKMELADASYILTYYAMVSAKLDPTWSDVIA